MIFRIIANIAIILSLFFLPFWVSLVLSFAALIYFKKYFEIMPFFLITDMLYGLPEERYLGFTIISISIGIVLYVTVSLIKKKIITHDQAL